MKNKNCIISAVGKNSLHKTWVTNNKKIDLHLIVYDDSYDKYKNDTKFICSLKGYKLRLVYLYLQQHPEYIEQYDYFFIPDDDISINEKNIKMLFRMMRKYNLQIAQPALTNSYYTYPHTLRNKLCILHYTNFIEMMLPCFSKEALKEVLTTFNANESGWGVEWHWPLLINSNKKDMAIIDCIEAIHTRPVQNGRKENEIECNEYIQKHKLDTHIYTFKYIKLPVKCLKRKYLLITETNQYNYFVKLGNDIAISLINFIRQGKIHQIGLMGMSGISLYLAEFARISERKTYLDTAYSIIEHTTLFVNNIKTDFSLQNGLPGFCWVIEHLAQRGYIENNTDDILEVPIHFINDYIAQNHPNLNKKQKRGLAIYYQKRISNTHFSLRSILHQKERCLFESLDHNHTSITKKNPKEIKEYIDCFFNLHTATDQIQNKEWNTLLRIGWMIIILLSDEDTGLDFIL